MVKLETKDKVEVHSTVCLVRRCDCIKETPRPMHRTVIVSEPKSGKKVSFAIWCGCPRCYEPAKSVHCPFRMRCFQGMSRDLRN